MSHTLYSDAYFFVDPRVVILAQPVDGSGPHDGTYLLMLYIGLGREFQEVYVTYPTVTARNEAFSRLSTLRRAVSQPLPLASDCELDEDDDPDDHHREEEDR